MIPEASATNLIEAPSQPHLDAIVPLYGYQREAIEQKARVKIYKWFRQAGKDFVASLEAVLNALEDGQDWFIISLTERQAMATFDKVKVHLRAMRHVLEKLEFIDVPIQYANKHGDWCHVTAKKVVLPGGGSVSALPGRDPDAIAGLTGNVILTEFALLPENGVEHWRVVFPLITNGYRIIAISTPRGHGTKFAELCRNPAGKYWVSTVDVHRGVAEGKKLVDEDGNPISVEELEETYGDPAGWKREYLVIESDDLDALIAWRYLELARADYEAIRFHVDSIEDYNPDRENVFTDLPRGCFVGWDIARSAKGDLSSLWINEQVGDVFYLRALVTMHGMDFSYQKKVAWQAMERAARGAGDASGMGMQSCEETAKRFPGCFDEVNFSSRKGELGSKMMTTYQDVRQRFPKEGFDDVLHDLHAVQKETRLGRLILHETKNPIEKRSHCDMAYANGLALLAGAEGYAGPIECELGPARAMARAREF